MLRLIGRIFVILLLAGVISGATYWISQTDSASALMGSSVRGAERGEGGEQRFAPSGEGTERFGHEGREGRGANGAGGWTGILKNVGVIGLVTLAIAIPGTLWKRFVRPPRPRARAQTRSSKGSASASVEK